VVLPAALKVLYLAAGSRAWLKNLLPSPDYICSISDYSFAENFWNVFDELVVPRAFYHSQDEVVELVPDSRAPGRRDFSAQQQ